jgi:hypothetical protein
MVFLPLAWSIACREEPYNLELAVHLPEGGAELLDGHLLELVATDAAGGRTVLTLGAAQSGAGVTGVAAVPDGTVSIGLLAEDDGGQDGAIDLDRALAWGEGAFDGGTAPGSSSSASLFVGPFGTVAPLGPVAQNRRVLAGALAVDSRSRVFVFGGETPGRTALERSSAKVYRVDLDAGDRKLEPTGASFPTVTSTRPAGIGEEEFEYRGRTSLSATPVTVDGEERILVVGGQPRFDFPFGPSNQGFLYDPETDTLELEEMPIARSGHVAVRYRNGSVLLYGGFTDNAIPRASFHHWDPDRGFLYRGAAVLTAGAGHVAGVALEDDAVVCGGDLLTIAGSNQVWAPQDGCDLIRPNGETRDFDPLPQPLSGLAMATLADGSILAAGGFTQDTVDEVSGGIIQVFGEAPAVAKTFRWTAEGGWKAVGNLKQARVNHAMVALADGSAIVVGGDEVGTGSLADQVAPVRCAERFDPTTEEWTLLDCDESISGAYPLVGAQPAGGDVVVMAGLTFERTGEMDGGTALAVTSGGPAAE